MDEAAIEPGREESPRLTEKGAEKLEPKPEQHRDERIETREAHESKEAGRCPAPIEKETQSKEGATKMSTSTQNRATIGRVMALGFLLATLIASCLVLAAKPALAETTFAVDRNDDPDPTTANACTADPNDCSLRGAIVAANAADGPDDITLPAGTYTLSRAGAGEEDASTGDLDVTDELSITGAGARATSVAGGAAPFDDRIFDNRPDVSATITGLTITGGKVADGNGGGVRNEGDLTLDEVAVKDNTAGTGGGVDSRGGDLTLDGVAVKGNTSSVSGGIYSEKGTLNITDSTVSGNSAAEYFGGATHYSGLANITNSTISGNKGALYGGGVAAASATINVRNSTIASNESSGLGGGIFTVGPGSLVFAKNTIVASNSIENCDTAQFGGIIRSQGNNVSSDGSCGFTQPTDKQNTNPLLGPLQDNGGPTDTRALLSGSPAIDAGTNTDCPPTDQRGVDRPQGTACDIGAFENEAPPNAAPTASDDSYSAKKAKKKPKPLSVSAPGVLKNDSDPDSDPLSAELVSNPANGTLTSFEQDGTFSYTPKAKFKGADSFTYKASDGKGGVDEAKVTITVGKKKK